MVLKNLNNPRLACSVTDQGIKMRSGHIKGAYMFYKFDGTYEVGKKKYPTLYGKQIIMTKVCPNCHTLNPDNPHYIYTKSRSAGFTSPHGTNAGWAVQDFYIRDLKTKCCQYVFNMNSDVKYNYSVDMVVENIRYHNVDMFCHITTEFGKSTAVHRARFVDRLDAILRLNVPVMNLSGVTTMEQVLEKIKLYTVFS